MNNAVFLDRDGVINRAFVRGGRPVPPKNLDEVEILPGVIDALQLLKKDGFLAIVVTNQPDVSRGLTSREMVEAIHDYLRTCLPLDAILTCYHDDEDSCNCRKPKPGALLEAARRFDIDLANSFMVGDRWKDTEAGLKAGCNTFYIDYGYNEKKPSYTDYTVRSLREASEIMIGLRGRCHDQT